MSTHHAKSVITIGNFDGVHLGHKAILQTARRIADERAASVIALTFDPAPASVLRGGQIQLRITDLDHRIALLKEAGADRVEVVKPDLTMLGLSAQEFVKSKLLSYQPTALVEGSDFRLGKGRAGDMTLLSTLGAELGFSVHGVESCSAVLDNLHITTISSTFIRWLVRHGRMIDASRCLGRWFTLKSVVVTGEQRGRTLGVPTINFDPTHWHDKLLPSDGVFAGYAILPNGARYAVAISIGLKPTFGKHARVIEAHLLDFSGNLYDQTITLEFRRWLRDQMHFPSVENLQRKLQSDIAEVRRLHEHGLLEDNSKPQPINDQKVA